MFMNLFRGKKDNNIFLKTKKFKTIHKKKIILRSLINFGRVGNQFGRVDQALWASWIKNGRVGEKDGRVGKGAS